MIVDSRRVCEVLVGLGDVNILGVEDLEDQPLRIHIETRIDRPDCSNCDGQLWIKDRPMVELVDLACFGRPTRLVWRKRRWRCPNHDCDVDSFTESDPEIAGARSAMTTRAARWVTFQVGKNGRSVKEVAAELETDWHTVNNTVVAMGEQLLTSDASRVGTVHALGVDEVLVVRQGKWRTQLWSTQIVDVHNRQLLDVIPDRTAAGLCAWLGQQPVSWRNRIAWAALDLSGPWRNAFDTMLPHATQVADPFHVVKLANLRLDECRRRTQHETLGHRGRKHDPLYRSRRLLTKAHERLSAQGEHRLLTLLERGDPKGEVRMTWHVKEAVRSFYDCETVDDATAYLDELIENITDHSMPEETRQLGRTLRRWRTHLISWHKSRVSNGATEGINNMIKRVKRVAYGFTSFRNYRIRSLLYAGKPNWKLLPTIRPR